MKKILVATYNKGKAKEIKEALSNFEFEIITLSDEGISQDIEETGETYEENAILKAEFFGKLTGLPTIADDSGIIVEALINELGVKTRRWGAGEKASDEEWLSHFLNRLENEENRNAEFISCIALYHPKQETKTFTGKCKGVITKAPQVEIQHGIPLSSVFLAHGQNKVFSALTMEEKNGISHRGKALQEFLNYLLSNSI